MIRSSEHLVGEQLSSDLSSVEPKQPYLAAIHALSSHIGGLEAFFDENGRLRTLTTSDAQGLFTEPCKGLTSEAYASRFINAPAVIRALGLRHAELLHTNSVAIPNLGKRVEFRQTLTINSQTYPVRAGYVHVFINRDGKIFQVNSTVRHGRKPSFNSKSIISANEALAKARLSLDVKQSLRERAELVFSSHNGKIEPVYEVTITTENPRRVVLVLVRAINGQVVHRTNKLRTEASAKIVLGSSRRRQRRKPTTPDINQSVTTPVPTGKTFLRIPDPNANLLNQIHEVVLNMLPDRSVLKNDNCIIYLGSSKKEVRAKSDGSFLYTHGEAEFAAVTTFFAFNAQMELYKSWGMTPPTEPIPIYVNDPNVRDNAYFDPEAYEIHLGIGSGLPRGLTRNIAYDLGVTWHENGHHVVFLQTPGQDLPGAEGGAIHESMGDVLGDLLMDFWFRLTYGNELKATLTNNDVDKDTRVIGKYALPPNGIRIQKNKKRTPQDKTGEPHDDGLISGGAKADLLVAMATQKGADLKKALEDFGKITLAALTLVPAHKVSFQDLLKAYLTADQQLNAAANKDLITKSFGDHGIVLKNANRHMPPLIVIK
ncbi:MAG: hypothetical protein K2W82_16350 [Candidatus Obscuribacterales bacterium]|nr:hypothetical protein [Candidatus Obscuribacterales bacterium]